MALVVICSVPFSSGFSTLNLLMQVSENLRVVFKSNHRSINDAGKESDRDSDRKQSLFRCNWLEDRVSSTCDPEGLLAKRRLRSCIELRS